MIAVHFGAKLVQNINLAVHGYSNSEEKGRGELVNDLIFAPAYVTLEARLLMNVKKKKIQTCSLHHQGLYKADIPEELDVIAHTPDNIVEAFRHRTLPIAGVQFHPEEDLNKLGKFMISALIEKSPNLKHENKGNSVAVKS